MNHTARRSVAKEEVLVRRVSGHNTLTTYLRRRMALICLMFIVVPTSNPPGGGRGEHYSPRVNNCQAVIHRK